MRQTFEYDAARDPPAPVLPVRIAAPGRDVGVLVPMLVDSGADCTVVPVSLVRRLDLPRVDQVHVRGAGGSSTTAPVHAAVLAAAGQAILARVVGLGEEALLGRDLLRRVGARLDGPRARLTVTSSRGRPRRSS